MGKKRGFYGKADDKFVDIRNSKENRDEHDVDSQLKPNETIKSGIQPLELEKSKRKRKLRETLLAQHQQKMTKQKRKRLDKYIEHQLKREEKEILFKKLEETRIDTSILRSSKLIGTGDKKTKREKFQEAMELERLGKGNEETRKLLYEEREVKHWDSSDEEQFSKKVFDENEGDRDEDPSDFKSTNIVGTGFVDFRPSQPFTGMGTGFGFSNIKKKKTSKKKKSYSWRARVESEESKLKENEDEMDFISDSDSENEVVEAEDYSSNEEQEESNEKNLIGNDNEAEFKKEKDEQEESEQEESEQEESEQEESEQEESEQEESEQEESEQEESEQEDSEQEESAQEEINIKKEHTKRAQDFKAWAEEQALKMEGIDKYVVPSEPQMKYESVVRQEDLQDGLKEDFVRINELLDRRIYTVEVQRPYDIQAARMQLPVFGEEHRIMEAVHHNDCVIICGETGSGKTTQVPQFLFESGFGSPGSDSPGMIGITQPRRVAAVAMANRVGMELGNYGDRVGYQIRFDATVSENTSLKFMTDGVLLREMMNDFLLLKYSALIIDEAHERNVNTDILIGMLSRVLKLRRQYHQKDPSKYGALKLIIMSATLRVSDFSENKVLFDIPPPILKVDARQYPVSTHFNKRTAFNYAEEAFRKTSKIHRRLPKGAILIFMTGKAEIVAMVKKLRKEFPMTKSNKHINQKRENSKDDDSLVNVRVDPNNVDVEVEEIDFEVNEMEINEEKNLLSDEDEEGEEEGFEEILEEDQSENDPLYVLPLFSLLPTSEQMKVFLDPPAGTRLCVVATNVAETSLTIPNVRYVVDCGRAKERKYNEETGVQSFEVGWISKASADQRAGRAGRTGPGHCYRLYSSAVYESDFPQFSTPEILRMPVEGVVLNMKSMGIQTVSNFPFPTPPDRKMLVKSEQLLKFLGALNKERGDITDLGRKMSLFPLSPRFSKMLIIGNQQDCLPYIIALVSGMSVGDPFLNEYDVGIQLNDIDDEENEDERPNQQEIEAKRKLKNKFNKSKQIFTRLDKYSDSLKLLSAICAVDHITLDKRLSFFKDHFLREKQMIEIQKLRKQLTYIVNVNTMKESIAAPSNVENEDLKLGKPSKVQIQAIKQMIAAGFIDQIAVRLDIINKEFKLNNNSKIINIPYVSVTPSTTYHERENTDPFVYIHPSSIIVDSGEAPEYLVYQSLNKGNGTGLKKIKLKMKPLTDIKGKSLANVGKRSGLVTYSKPLGHPYGPKTINENERECYVVPHFGAVLNQGTGGWDLPAQKVKQKKIQGSWEVV